ncbi:MAG: Nif3-like dinuclear metal center hexameric protein [Defluviitaleaceae bacterium]|nr:Nif3-like dinuclear metal center hexameric protein [Defluviitaleaceae bacterium]MCL2275937.1 Nif3-like dinuclear metal center hexameric protein [Defluviitaleaceae bacterium]
MNTQELMNIALKAANLKEMPNDCGIIVPGNNIKKVLMGVDMDTAELLLAKQLGYDCVISHHPRNTHVNMLDVLHDHIDKLEALGVPRNRSQKLLAGRKDELSYNQHVSNSRRSESAAKLMNMPYMCIHTPTDIIGEAMVQEFLDKKFAKKPQTKVKEIVEALEKMPEYKNSARKPVIRVGAKDSYAGKIYVLMSGLTGPGEKILKEYFEAGVGTLVMMHIPEKDAKAIKEQAIGNVVIAGHMSSDSLGMNKLASLWKKKGVDTTMMSGVVSG